MPSPVSKLIPPSGFVRTLWLQSILYGIGGGAFNTAAAVFFTQRVGLTAAQVGLGFSIETAAFLVAAYPAGRSVDRFGAQRLWALTGFLTTALLLSWPFIHGFAAFVAMSVGMAFVGSISNSARSAYIINSLPHEERIKSQAFFYSAINIGFTLGALTGGIALALKSTSALVATPVFFAAIMLINAWRITRMPPAQHGHVASPEPESVEQPTKRAPKPKPEGPSPLRNPAYMVGAFFFGILGAHDVLLNTVIPLWLVTETDSPHWLLAWLFGTNTVMCIFLPQLTSAKVSGPKQALRAIELSCGFFVVSCLITWSTHSTTGFLTALLVWLGHMTVTGAELYMTGATWVVEANYSDPRRRGEYQGVAELFGGLGRVWIPAAFTFLAMGWSGPGWPVIAGIVIVAAVGLHPSIRGIERFAKKHFPEGIGAAPDEPEPGPEPGVVLA